VAAQAAAGLSGGGQREAGASSAPAML